MFEIIPFDYHTSRSSYDPFRHFEEMERQMFSNPVSNFRADVLTKGDSFVIEAELPGFKKEDINLDIEDDILTIKATRQNEESEEDSKRKFIRRERFYGSYTRSFDVSNIDTSAITAEYNDGILTLVLPKKAPEKPKTRHLDEIFHYKPHLPLLPLYFIQAKAKLRPRNRSELLHVLFSFSFRWIRNRRRRAPYHSVPHCR